MFNIIELKLFLLSLFIFGNFFNYHLQYNFDLYILYNNYYHENNIILAVLFSKHQYRNYLSIFYLNKFFHFKTSVLDISCALQVIGRYTVKQLSAKKIALKFMNAVLYKNTLIRNYDYNFYILEFFFIVIKMQWYKLCSIENKF